MNRPITKAWLSYRTMVMPQDADPAQVEETRRAFFAGAAVLFQAIMVQLSSGEEATQSDFDMLNSIQAELETFGQQLDLDILKPRTH